MIGKFMFEHTYLFCIALSVILVWFVILMSWVHGTMKRHYMKLTVSKDSLDKHSFTVSDSNSVSISVDAKPEPEIEPGLLKWMQNSCVSYLQYYIKSEHDDMLGDNCLSGDFSMLRHSESISLPMIKTINGGMYKIDFHFIFLPDGTVYDKFWTKGCRHRAEKEIKDIISKNPVYLSHIVEEIDRRTSSTNTQKFMDTLKTVQDEIQELQEKSREQKYHVDHERLNDLTRCVEELSERVRSDNRVMSGRVAIAEKQSSRIDGLIEVINKMKTEDAVSHNRITLLGERLDKLEDFAKKSWDGVRNLDEKVISIDEDIQEHVMPRLGKIAGLENVIATIPTNFQDRLDRLGNNFSSLEKELRDIISGRIPTEDDNDITVSIVNRIKALEDFVNSDMAMSDHKRLVELEGIVEWIKIGKIPSENVFPRDKIISDVLSLKDSRDEMVGIWKDIVSRTVDLEKSVFDDGPTNHALANYVSGLRGDIDSRLKELDEKYTSISSRSAEVDGDISRIDSCINSVCKDIEKLEKSVSGLRGDIARIDNKLRNLFGIHDNGGIIGRIDSAIGSLQRHFREHEDEHDNLNPDRDLVIKELIDRVKGLELTWHNAVVSGVISTGTGTSSGTSIT